MHNENSSFQEDYLLENPGFELSLYMDWVMTCFQWEKTTPTSEEIQLAREMFHHGKTPRSTVDELLRRRKNGSV